MTNTDKDILRNMVKDMNESIYSEKNHILIKNWKSLNDLKAIRPMVLVQPEGAWREIKADWNYQCESKIGRYIEDQIKTNMYKFDYIQDDSTLDNFLTIPLSYESVGFGVNVRDIHSNSANGSYAYKASISNLDDDLGKLKYRELIVNDSINSQQMKEAQDAIGDLIPLHFGTSLDWTNGLTWDAIKLIGLENLMLYMYDDPEGLHRLMSFLRDERLNWLYQMETSETLGLNSGSSNVGSGNLGHNSHLPTSDNPPESRIGLKHIWGFSESQETVGVSPDMFGEFIFPYQKPIIDKFGLAYYGCCEPIEGRFEYIKRIDNLRCLSVSPWADQEKCAELIKTDYVYCRKTNPAPICVGYDEKSLIGDIRNTLKAAGDLNLMIVLKDTHTIEKEPERLVRWISMVRKQIDLFSGL